MSMNPYVLKDQPGRLSQPPPILQWRKLRHRPFQVWSSHCVAVSPVLGAVVCSTAGLFQGHCASVMLPRSLEGLIDKHTSKYHQLWDHFFSPFLEVLVNFLLINLLRGMLGHYLNYKTAYVLGRKCRAPITATWQGQENASHGHLSSPAAFSWKQSAEFELSLSELVRWDFSHLAWFVCRRNLNLSVKSHYQICLSVATLQEYFYFF